MCMNTMGLRYWAQMGTQGLPKGQSTRITVHIID